MQADIQDAVTFVHVIEEGSFTGAARRLQVPVSSVSRRVSRLEDRLATRLLQRTTRALHLTDAGRLYHSHAERMLEEFAAAERAVTELSAEPAGRVRITTPLDIGDRLTPLLTEFLARWPRVELQVVMTQRVVNIVDEGFDCAIRAGTLPDSSLVARKLLGGPGLHIFASPDYLARAGTPTGPDDLPAHACIVYTTTGSAAKWTVITPDGVQHHVRVHGRLAMNDPQAIKVAAVAGAGLALLPDILCGRELHEGKLVRVLEGVGTADDNVWFVYPSRDHLSAAVSALADFLSARFSEQFACPSWCHDAGETGPATGLP
ncbi:MAG: hypothetical protein RIT45_1408 [Pseudomonadota bacterium]